jgi:predicted HicB family RNase H-like nuclease
MNTIEIKGYQAFIQYDPDIEMFRGEFIGLNGGADFYARDIEGLFKEGRISLNVFLDMCREDGAAPRKEYCDKFNFSIQSESHTQIPAVAAATL